MSLKKTSAAGLLLLVIGTTMFLGQLGIHVGWLLSIFISCCLLIKGWRTYHNSESHLKKAVGGCLVMIGFLWLMGVLHVIIGLAIGAFLVYAGWKMIKNHEIIKGRDYI